MKAEEELRKEEIEFILRFHSNEIEHFSPPVRVGGSVEWDLSGRGTS